jgi:hypothetical protein
VESDYQEEILKLLPQKVRAILKLLWKICAREKIVTYTY